MEEADYVAIKGKIVSGVFALTTRTFILQIISFAATFILTILLSPSVFGVFFLVSAVISFLSYFSDVGLAAALIQKKEEPTRDELVSVFTLQQLLIGSIVAVSFSSSSILASFYQFGSDGEFLLKALLISFFLSSLKTIPSILLERKLEFSLLIVPQILETFIFYVIAIVLAILGAGINSFAYAALGRGIVGLVAIYIICPWPVGLRFSLSSVKHLLSFGIPFQINSLLALVKDDLMILFLGKILPFSQIGYLGWAKKWAEVPLRLIIDSVVKVTFPAYARLQHDKSVLAKALEKSLFFLSLFIFPATFLLILLIHTLIFLIPRYGKWEPALTAFYLFAFASVWAAFSSPIVNALNAIGKIKITLLLMIVWTTLTWILVPILVTTIGYNGVAVTAFIISFTGFLPLFIMRRMVVFHVFKPIWKPFVSSIIAVLPAFFLLRVYQNLPSVILSIISSISIYAILCFFSMREEIVPYFPKFLRTRS